MSLLLPYLDIIYDIQYPLLYYDSRLRSSRFEVYHKYTIDNKVDSFNMFSQLYGGKVTSKCKSKYRQRSTDRSEGERKSER
mmetsp:Transcript_14164/g.16381  ORF Transcript_14164/g.16381 Transcript_14164/m.16381 type:complete len:81 (+) Transcript_14164:138-380(+)